MRSWDSFYPDVLPDVLGCPEPTVDRHLQRAAREFFAKSHVWMEDLDPIRTSAATPLYDIDYPPGCEGVELRSATLDGEDIGIDVRDGTTAADRRRGNAGRYRVLTGDLRTVQVMPNPGAGRTLILSATIQPADNAPGVYADVLADKYRAAIATGALATLLVLNKAPWMNPQLAGLKADQFKAAIADARSKAFRAHSNARPRTVPSYF